jgi:hypothetical protein
MPISSNLLVLLELCLELRAREKEAIVMLAKAVTVGYDVVLDEPTVLLGENSKEDEKELQGSYVTTF